MRQNLPVVIHPKNLAMNNTPWTLLKWQMADGKLTVKNDSPYVVRLGQQVSVEPGNGHGMLPKPYLLPGDSVTLDGDLGGTQVAKVKFTPASVYGYVISAYEAPVGAAAGEAASAS